MPINYFLVLAAFLATLNWATTTRLDNPWLLYLLPVAGLLAVGLLAGGWRSDHYANQTEAAWRTAYLHAVTPTLSPASRP